jgi:hypothetical protein
LIRFASPQKKHEGNRYNKVLFHAYKFPESSEEIFGASATIITKSRLKTKDYSEILG